MVHGHGTVEMCLKCPYPLFSSFSNQFKQKTEQSPFLLKKKLVTLGESRYLQFIAWNKKFFLEFLRKTILI